ncbi:unnamed protein product, partial [Allacma fusca]
LNFVYFTSNSVCDNTVIKAH